MSQIGYLRVPINSALRIILENITLTVFPVYLSRTENNTIEYEINLVQSIDNRFESILKDRLRMCNVEVESVECYKMCKTVVHENVPVVIPMIDSEGELTHGDSLLSSLVNENSEIQVEANFNVTVVVITERMDVRKNAIGYVVREINMSSGKFKLRNHLQLFDQLRKWSGISTQDVLSFATLY